MHLEKKCSLYLKDLLNLNPDELDQLYLEQRQQKRPIIKQDTARFLRQIVKISKPLKILEIGMNAGFSATVMAKYMPEQGALTTIDCRLDNAHIARHNFKKYKVYDKIEIIIDLAEKVIAEIDEYFDLIFIDADKKNNKIYLDYALSHINMGGIILVDNLLWKGDIYNDIKNPHPSVITIREFNDYFVTRPDCTAQILPLGDGLGFLVKK